MANTIAVHPVRTICHRHGFGGEVGHVLIPWRSIEGIEDLRPPCNCGRTGDLESLCSLTAIRRTLLPHVLPKYPGHPLQGVDPAAAATISQASLPPGGLGAGRGGLVIARGQKEQSGDGDARDGEGFHYDSMDDGNG